MQEHELIHDWNVRDTDFDWSTATVMLDDETLRDGLQNPSVTSIRPIGVEDRAAAPDGSV